MARKRRAPGTTNHAPTTPAPSPREPSPATKKVRHDDGSFAEKYHPAYPRTAYMFCLLGATDADLAELFEVSVPTIGRWRREKPAFKRACYEGKEYADAQVAASLHKRAVGYEVKAEKVVVADGVAQTVAYKEHVPADVHAGQFWLMNRRRGSWLSPTKVEHSGPDGGPIMTKELGDQCTINIMRRLDMIGIRYGREDGQPIELPPDQYYRERLVEMRATADADDTGANEAGTRLNTALARLQQEATTLKPIGDDDEGPRTARAGRGWPAPTRDHRTRTGR